MGQFSALVAAIPLPLLPLPSSWRTAQRPSAFPVGANDRNHFEVRKRHTKKKHKTTLPYRDGCFKKIVAYFVKFKNEQILKWFMGLQIIFLFFLMNIISNAAFKSATKVIIQVKQKHLL